MSLRIINADTLWLDAVFSKMTFGPETTAAELAAWCELLSTPAWEVKATVECVDGKPVVYLRRESTSQAVPAFLRRQAE